MPFADKPTACRQCPAYQWGRGFVPSEGPLDAQWLMLGQGPGETEALNSSPFHEDGRAGWRLRRWIGRAGLSVTRVLIHNTVLCWLPEGLKNSRPYGNRPPTAAESTHCWNAHVGPFVHEWDARTRPPDDTPDLRHLITIGAPATRQVLGEASVEKYVGTTQWVEIPAVEDAT